MSLFWKWLSNGELKSSAAGDAVLAFDKGEVTKLKSFLYNVGFSSADDFDGVTATSFFSEKSCSKSWIGVSLLWISISNYDVKGFPNLSRRKIAKKIKIK